MPKVTANNITMNYDQQGTGEPRFSFRIWPPITPATRFRCRSTRNTSRASRSTSGELENPSKPRGAYTTEVLADDVAAFMQARASRRLTWAGLSLGAAVGMWLAAKYPDKVQSLSLHSSLGEERRTS